MNPGVLFQSASPSPSPYKYPSKAMISYKDPSAESADSFDNVLHRRDERDSMTKLFSEVSTWLKQWTKTWGVTKRENKMIKYGMDGGWTSKDIGSL